MTAEHVLREAQSRGLTLRQRGGKLVVAPARNCPPELAELLRTHKAEILSLLEARAANLAPDLAPWLHVAKQVLAGEFEGADNSTRESITIGLRSITHPACQQALERVRLASA